VPTGNWGSTDLGGTVGTLQASIPLRVGMWKPEDAEVRSPRGTVFVVQGRGEFVEVYGETVGDILSREYCVVAFDFRGQGGSHRRTPRGGHVDRFEDYVGNLSAVIRFASQQGLPRPYHVLAHSMGGLVALLAAPALARDVERMVLVAPLLEVMGLPAPSGLLSLAAGLGSVAGLARRPVSEPAAVPRQFAGNRLTSDPARFEWVKRLVDDNPDLVTGPPTIGWISAAFQAMNLVRRRAGRPLTIPTLFVASGQDAIVSTPAIDRFARATPGAGLLVVPGARHQILLERDGLRNLFFAAFDAYIADAPRRLETARQQRFARTLRFDAAASGPPRGPAATAPSRKPTPEPAAPEAAAAAEVAAEAADAREVTSAEALAVPQPASAGREAEPSGRAGIEAVTEARMTGASGMEAMEGQQHVPAAPERLDTVRPDEHAPNGARQRATRIRNRLRRRSRRHASANGSGPAAAPPEEERLRVDGSRAGNGAGVPPQDRSDSVPIGEAGNDDGIGASDDPDHVPEAATGPTRASATRGLGRFLRRQR